MSDSEKPKSSCWERIKRIKHDLAALCVSIDRKCKPTERRFDQCAILNILGHAGRPVAIVSIIIGMVVYVMGCPERQRQAENQRKAKQYQAWQVINAAKGGFSSGGRIDALQDLANDNVSLAGVDLSNAYLNRINLKKGASLYEANLTGANIFEANLAGVYFADANCTGTFFANTNLRGTDFRGANLKGAILTGVEFNWSDLRDSNLTDIRDWQRIKNIEFANIYSVKNPPDGFIEWATEHGAVSIKDDEEWGKIAARKKRRKSTTEIMKIS